MALNILKEKQINTTSICPSDINDPEKQNIFLNSFPEDFKMNTFDLDIKVYSQENLFNCIYGRSINF